MKTRVLNTGVYMLDLVEKFTCEFVRTEVHTRLFSTIPNQEKKKKYVWWWENVHSQSEPREPAKIKVKESILGGGGGWWATDY